MATVAAIVGKGVFTPEHTITNEELAEAYNGYVAKQIPEDTIEGATKAKPKKKITAEHLHRVSGIESRFVVEKSGILDPERMAACFSPRSDDMPSLSAEMAMSAARDALAQANLDPPDINLVICAASNMERAYPAIAVEVQALLGAKGFAFDMNVACSSATFAIQCASQMINTGAIRSALIVSPEICSAHTEWRDRDCNFIFGDVATAIVLQRSEDSTVDRFLVKSTSCETLFSNNIRNNNGFLRRAHDQMEDRRDMQFMQQGRKVFREVLPLVVNHIRSHLEAQTLTPDDLKRFWLHQANKYMNDFIGKQLLGRDPTEEEQPDVLRTYGNTSSAGSIIAFSKYSDGLKHGDLGLICSFGAGYSVGSVVLETVKV